MQLRAVLTVVQLSGGTKLALTDRDEIIVMEQAPVPAHDPDHPMNAPDVPEIANKETTVPWLYTAEHVAPQSIPAGFEETVPVPAPDLPTESVCCKSAKVALTVTIDASLAAIWQVAVPEQPPPDQPVNVEPTAGFASRVTSVAKG